MNLLVNIDVPDLEAGLAFYCGAFGLTVGRRLGPGAAELIGAAVPVWLLEKPEGSPASPAGGPRDYARHWTPVHLDTVVDDVPSAVARAVSAGATLESAPRTHAWGTIAMLADPFGNGFCVLAFSEEGYDAIADAPE